MRSTCEPIAAQVSVAFWTSSGAVFGSGVRITCRPWYRVGSACSMPATSLPAMGCAGTKEPMRSLSTRRAASTTSRLVEPTSITSTPGSTRCRIALKVASVADTGTAMSTMSEPDTASSADSAAWSMMPRRRALSVVDGDLL